MGSDTLLRTQHTMASSARDPPLIPKTPLVGAADSGSEALHTASVELERGLSDSRSPHQGWDFQGHTGRSDSTCSGQSQEGGMARVAALMGTVRTSGSWGKEAVVGRRGCCHPEARVAGLAATSQQDSSLSRTDAKGTVLLLPGLA